jgi:protein PhnA
MKLKQTPELYSFLSTYFPDADPDADEQAVGAFIKAASSERQQQVVTQLKFLLLDMKFPMEELGTEVNRWFADIEEAHTWLRQILSLLEKNQSTEAMLVKDVNGTPLSEGDSVQVIKDLKVKGGSSDLKRGTLIKKIHLIGDPNAIECRVEGSTLVLKTCFLKKS